DNDNRIPEEILKNMSVDGKIIMEVGAATARDSVTLSKNGAVAFALDYSDEALKLAGVAAMQANAKLFLVCGDAEALPFKDNSIDLVFHQGVLEHFRNPEPLLHENHRVLKPGGTVLVDVPQTVHIYTIIKKTLIALNMWFAGWETQFTSKSLSKLLQDTGFEPNAVYGRFFSPSLAYRMFREVLMKIGIRLPLHPVLIPPIHRFRTKIRQKLEKTFMAKRFGYIVGVFAHKKEND
ncbi:MAG: class I SAM-dependent methyltransferase, partial [FCB group bacterium]|nr:class I SAM-dependent methyltransferase [FCB group bacterium]